MCTSVAGEAFMTDLGQSGSAPRRSSASAKLMASAPRPCSRSWTPPLGRAIGNAVEVREVLDGMGGGSPHDVRDPAIAEGESMMRLAGIDGDPAKAARR